MKLFTCILLLSALISQTASTQEISTDAIKKVEAYLHRAVEHDYSGSVLVAFMEPRVDFSKISRGVFEAMFGLERYLRKCGLEENLLNLVRLRASQINGCAYYYSDRERAALAWTEAVTKISDGHVPDSVYDEVRRSFSEKELADLTLAVCAINSWNRLNIAARTVPGNYQPRQFAALTE